MIDLFKQPYHRHNYTHEEVTSVLERGSDERYIIRNYDRLKTEELTRTLNISNWALFRRLKRLGLKKSRPISKKQRGPDKKKLVLNLETGIYYQSLRQAAESIGFHHYTLGDWLSRRTTRRDYRGRKTPDYQRFKIV